MYTSTMLLKRWDIVDFTPVCIIHQYQNCPLQSFNIKNSIVTLHSRLHSVLSFLLVLLPIQRQLFIRPMGAVSR